MIRVNYDAKRKGYQILKPCDKCGQWNEAFVTKALLEFSEQQFDTYEELKAYEEGRPVDPEKLRAEKEQIVFYTSPDPKFQLKIKKDIDKVFKKESKRYDKKFQRGLEKSINEENEKKSR